MKKKVKGNYTLEAAILMPLILFILLALIYTGFILYDRGVIQGEVNLLVLRGEAVVRNSMEPNSGSINYEAYLRKGIFGTLSLYDGEANILAEELTDSIEDKVLIATITNTTVELTTGKARVVVSAEFNIPIKGIRKFFIKSGTGFAYEEVKSFDNAEEFIRRFRIMMDTGEELPGGDSILSTLSKYLEVVH